MTKNTSKKIERVVYKGRVYDLVLLIEEIRESKEVNYGLYNRENDVIESMCSALFMAYDLLKELESNLVESLPKPPLGLVQ